MSSKTNKKFAIVFAALLAGWSTPAWSTATQTTTYTNTYTNTTTNYTSYTNTQTYTVTSTHTDTSQSITQKEAYEAYMQAKAQAQNLMNTGMQWEMVGLIVMANAHNQGKFMEGVWIYLTGQNIYNDGLRAYNTAQLKQNVVSVNTNMMLSMTTGVNTSINVTTGTSESYRLTSVNGDGKSGMDGKDGVGKDGNGIKIDPSLLRNGQFDDSLAELANKTGISKDDLVDALQNGDAASMVADKNGMAGSLQDALDNAKNNPMTMADLKEKYPELADASGNGTGNSSDSTYNLAGGAGSSGRGPASDLSSLANSLSGTGKNAGDQGGGNVRLGKDKSKISPTIQAAFDRAGITNLTIFQIVHRQYIKRTPVMFGTEAQAVTTPQKNPFAKSPFEGLEKDPSNLSL